MNRILSVLIVILLLSLALTGCGQPVGSPNSAPPGETATPAETELRVGMECAYAPFNWTQTDDANGAVAIEGGGFAGGYDVEIAKKVAQGLGRKLVIVKTEWDGLLPAVTSGKIDAIMAGMSPTAARRESIDFSASYYTSDLVLVVKKDGPYANAKTLHDFSGAKVTGQLNTFHYSVVDQLAGVDKQTAMEDFPTMVIALTSGKIDAYVSERPGASSAIASNPNLTFVAFEPGQGFQHSVDEVSIAVGLKKGSPLTEEINEALSGISQQDRQTLMENAVKNQPAAE